MNETGMPQGGQGQGRDQALEMISQIGQIVQQNNQMLNAIGEMLSQATGQGEPQGGGDEAALREEAMRRLAAQQG
jgi:hypothetical protein